MSCPSSIRAVLTGLLTLTLGALVAMGPPAAAAPALTEDPLVVHIDTITPVIPRSDNIQVPKSGLATGPSLVPVTVIVIVEEDVAPCSSSMS